MEPNGGNKFLTKESTEQVVSTSLLDSLVLEDSYVQVHIHGKFDRTSLLEIFTDIVAICTQNKLKNILVVSRMNELSGIDALRLLLLIKNAGVTSKNKIAWVERNIAEVSINRFVLNVFVNHGELETCIFSNEECAKNWLLS